MFLKPRITKIMVFDFLYGFLSHKKWTLVHERFVFAASGKLEISTNGRDGLGNFWPVKSTDWEGGE